MGKVKSDLIITARMQPKFKNTEIETDNRGRDIVF